MKTYTCDRCGKQNIPQQKIANVSWDCVHVEAESARGEARVLEIRHDCLEIVRTALEPVKVAA